MSRRYHAYSAMLAWCVWSCGSHSASTPPPPSPPPSVPKVICTANDVRCSGQHEVTTCSANGTALTVTKCPDDASLCTGAGLCVQCVNFADCPQPMNPCQLGACKKNVCETVNRPKDATCPTGTCSEAAVCQSCTPGVTRCSPDDFAIVQKCDASGVFQVGQTCDPATAPSCEGATCTPIPTDKLVAWYKLDGNAADSSTSAANGTMPLGAFVTDRFGTPNGAYSDAGIGSLAPANAALPVAQGARTISLWIRADARSGQRIAAGYGAWQPQGGFFGLGLVDNHAAFIGSKTGITNSTVAATGSAWHHLLATYDGTAVALYVDNDQPMRAALSLDTANQRVTIGQTPSDANVGDTESFHGTIDDVRIFARVLNEAEIAALYHQGGWR